MSSLFTESIVKKAALAWLEGLGYTILHGPEIAVGMLGHGLRDFCNYVHPAEQLAHGFLPDAHTARIGFQVVIAAAEDLVRAAAAVAERTGQG